MPGAWLVRACLAPNRPVHLRSACSACAEKPQRAHPFVRPCGAHQPEDPQVSMAAASLLHAVFSAMPLMPCRMLPAVMPCHAMPCCLLPRQRHAMPRHASIMPCQPMLSCAMPCLVSHAMPCHAMPCLLLPCHGQPMPCHGQPMSCRALHPFCHALPQSRHATGRHVPTLTQKPATRAACWRACARPRMHRSTSCAWMTMCCCTRACWRRWCETWKQIPRCSWPQARPPACIGRERVTRASACVPASGMRAWRRMPVLHTCTPVHALRAVALSCHAFVMERRHCPQTALPAGYPFDVPAEGAGLLSYCALSYHLPLVVPFSVKVHCAALGHAAVQRAVTPRQQGTVSRPLPATHGAAPPHVACPPRRSAPSLCGAAACCSGRRRCAATRAAYSRRAGRGMLCGGVRKKCTAFCSSLGLHAVRARVFDSLWQPPAPVKALNSVHFPHAGLAGWRLLGRPHSRLQVHRAGPAHLLPRIRHLPAVVRPLGPLASSCILQHCPSGTFPSIGGPANLRLAGWMAAIRCGGGGTTCGASCECLGCAGGAGSRLRHALRFGFFFRRARAPPL